MNKPEHPIVAVDATEVDPPESGGAESWYMFVPLHRLSVVAVPDLTSYLEAVRGVLRRAGDRGDRWRLAAQEQLHEHGEPVNIELFDIPEHSATSPDEPFVALYNAFVNAFRDAGGRLEDSESAEALGKRLGKQAAAATAWRERVGETLETEQVARLLGITRQALDSRKRTGSVLALAGVGTSYYPTWQFKIDGDEATVRPITLSIVSAFRERDENVTAHKIAAWATSPQPELDGQTPAAWIEADGKYEPVLLAATRTAALEVL